ncbi:M20 metallopeptidase family protein [Brevibacillus laterosporus]|uniref:Putative hydrolase YxeP n=1 Tax=Brevibacillus laterosporus LMG 15441 TaxID=1042163 RepID=A0A075RBH0_BRELA|nr:amidohydrolase [Brevibacillus laterosporus]AIG26850.1 putative hydrolase YxeP [Brevibacillus laterosporus LMG 15441]RJL14534.1 amidohydrolase [Brevibacillus laterosporus]
MIQPMLERLEQLYPELVKFRRDLHMYPELSFQEVNTPIKIADYLRQIGLEVKTGVGGNGVLGVLKGGKPGKTVALRADFDALPIQDEKEVIYKSRVHGVMHACGHDIHTAGLLGVAKVLSEYRDELPGTVIFIHQFAEELLPGGAVSMIEAGCLDGVDVIYGAHVSSDQPVGVVGVKSGYILAAADSFYMEITGKGGHGAYPHKAIDPLVIGSQLVLNLQQIVSRRIDPLQAAVLTVGSFHAGKAFNVIPQSVTLSGTVRTFDENVRQKIETSLEQITKTTCEGSGAMFTIDYERGYPALCNDETETERIHQLAKLLVGDDHTEILEARMGAEDFAYYLQKIPGTFFYVGGRNPEIQATYPHHHPMFDVDERSMLVAGKLFISAVMNYLTEGKVLPKSQDAKVGLEI